MVEGVFQAFAEVLFQIIFEMICGLTGQFILWAVTLGQRKPLRSRDYLASFIGLTFWIAIAVGVWLAFFR